jgi:hypothetical protein
MEPVANFGGGIDRLEITNTDIGAMRDMGWTVIPEPRSLLVGLCILSGMAIRRRGAG